MDNLKEENSIDEQSEETPVEREKKPARKKKTVIRQKKKTVSHKPKVKYIKPKKGNRIAISLVFTFLIVGISVLLSVSIIFLTKEMFGIDKSAASYTVKVPEDATVDDIIKLMTTDQEEKKKEPIIKVDRMFRLLVDLKGRKSEVEFVAGEHKLSPNMGYSDILTELTTTYYVAKETVKITIPEGKNIREAAALLEENNVCAADKLIYYFNKGLDDYQFIGNIPKASGTSLRFDRMEGYMFPDTYEFYKATYDDVESLEEDDYEIILRKFYDNFEEKYTQEMSDRAAELGMTMDKVITLASIVQKESRDAADMKKVASVFHNRLDNVAMFPTLGSDPTREYAQYVITDNSNPVNMNMVKAYNTYESAGLPPGPICNPGMDAINAVLWPEKTNYYYFCANIETKQVFYAETLEQHNENLILANINSEDY